jgi:hypothetical protein
MYITYDNYIIDYENVQEMWRMDIKIPMICDDRKKGQLIKWPCAKCREWHLKVTRKVERWREGESLLGGFARSFRKLAKSSLHDTEVLSGLLY